MSDPHRAFPALAPPSLSGSSIPNDDAALFSFISTPAPASYHVGVLAEIAKGTNQPGVKKTVQIKRGEELLCLPDWDLRNVDDEQIKKNTAVLIFVVSARLSSDSAKKYNSNLYDLAARLCVTGDQQQMSLCLSRVNSLAWGIVKLGRNYKKGAASIAPLQALVQRAAPSYIFTAAYPALLEVCLSHNEFEVGYQYAQGIFTDVHLSAPTYNDILAYHYHAGTVAVAMREYERARELFSFAVSMPTQSATAAQIACAKRAILCEIIISGKLLRFAKYTSSSVTRGIERNAAEYTKLAKAYQSRSWQEVRSTDEEPFRKDLNRGLLLLVLDSITMRRILHVRDVYSRLDLEELSRKVGLQRPAGLKQTEEVLRDMIETGAVRATITPGSDAKSTVVDFAEPDEPVNPSAVFAQLAEYNTLTTWLQAELAASGERFGISEQYLKKQSEMLTASGKGKGGMGRQMEDYETMIMNEGGASGGLRGNKVGTVAGNQNDTGY